MRRTAAALLLAVLATAPVAVPSAAAAQAKTATVDSTATLKFEPQSVTVAVGGKVTWNYTGGGFHTITSGDGSNPSAATPQNGVTFDGTVQEGSKPTFTFTFEKAGTYKYFCKPHISAGMVGEIVVGKGPAQPGPTSAVATASATPAPQPTTQGGGDATPNNPDASPAPGHAPGEGNVEVARIEARRAAAQGRVGAFLRLLGASTVALALLLGMVFVGTRSRRTPG